MLDSRRYWHWSALDEAKWLGLLPGWEFGETLPARLHEKYAEGLRRRRVDFTGRGPLKEATRRALLSALDDPQHAQQHLRAVIEVYEPNGTHP